MTGTPKPHTTFRRLGIAFFLGVPALLIAAVMPIQGAFGQPSSPATPGQAILTISQSDTPDPVTEGSNVSYTITVGNSTESVGDATDVTLVDSVSADVDFVSATPSQGSCDLPEGSFSCSLGTISPGFTATVTLVVTTTDRCSSGGGLRPLALAEPCTIYNDVTADSPDSAGSVFAEEDTTVNPAGSSFLSLSKSGSPDPVQELNPITYTLVVRNNGEGSANNVVVTDDLPAGTTFSSVSTTKGSCSHTATTVTCNLGTVSPSGEGPGETVTIVVQAPNVTADTTITNDSSVSSSNAGSTSSSANTLVLVSNGTSTQGDVPPDSTAPLTFTTATTAKGDGSPAVNGGDATAVSIVIPAGGPGGSILLEELPCTTSPCSGPGSGPQPAATVVLGNVVFNVVPPDNYPANKPFRVTLLYDKSLNPGSGPVFYFKEGVTASEIQLRQCGSPGPRGKAPCIVVNKKLHTNNALTNGDWKVILKINSDPRMHR